MKEIEIKILDIDVELITSKLKDAKKVLDAPVKAYYLFNEQLKQEIRIRTMGEKTYITHKVKIQSDAAKICEETEIEVNSLEKTLILFEKLGFVVQSSYTKQRVSYLYKNAHVEFDTYTGEFDFVPTFIEIEANSFEEIIDIASDLGYTQNDFKDWNGKQVIDYYKNLRERK